jgi:hypothetical protein
MALPGIHQALGKVTEAAESGKEREGAGLGLGWIPCPLASSLCSACPGLPFRKPRCLS